MTRDSRENFSEPVPLRREHLGALADGSGVHVVWGPGDEPLYVGLSKTTRARMLQHLMGGRDSSILFSKVGRLLDEELGRTAEPSEIEAWLGRCTFQVRYTDDPDSLKRSLVEEWSPRFNESSREAAHLPDGSGAANALVDVLEEVMSALARRLRGEASVAEYRYAVTEALPRVLRDLIPPGYVVKGSVGYGSPADVPWVSISRGVGGTAREGVYLVYLFSADGGRVFLALSQGVSNVKGGGQVLRKRALDLRDAVGAHPEWTPSIDLGSSNSLPGKYEDATVYAVRYDAGAVPDENALKRDLDAMIVTLSEVEDAGLAEASEIEPVHVVMKWSKELRSDTITQHRSIAAGQGSVWWGKFGTPGTSAMSAARLDMLRKQLATGTRTYCFLYRSGELWRTRLLAVTADPKKVDESRLPSYYSVSEAVLFLELTGFEEIHPATWAMSNLLLSSDPDPAKTKGALSNQTSPVLVYLRAGAETSTEQVAGTPDHLNEAVILTVAELPPMLDMDWLVSQTLCDRAWLEELVTTLERRPQIVLAGPPGTGKTWMARALARYLTQDEPLASRVVQFHASYGYEEFIEGLRPVSNGGGIQFARVDGVLLRMVDQIEDGHDQKHVLVLDEMNRANLPRVFGELMYLLEYRDQPIDLLYTQDFVLPRNLLLIGTMNTADRSIRSIDLALRRRFEVFDCPPDPAVLERYYQSADCRVPALLDGFTKLNHRLEELLDRHHTVGHSFFMADPMTPELLRAVWTRQLLPLFEEYFFDSPGIAASLTLEEFWPDASASPAD